MSPPTEQLIRDYLNRLSVAARGTLAPEDRKALIERTHDLIDRKAKSTDAVTSMEVAALLSRLGDPAVIVSREAARLAASRGEPLDMPQEQQPRRQGFLRRRAGPESWHWPRSSGGSDGQMRVLNPAPDTASKPVTRTPVSFRTGSTGPPSAAAASGAPASGVPASGVPASGVPASGVPASGVPASGVPASGSAGAASTTSGPTAGEQSGEREPPIWVPRQAASPESVTASPVADEPAPDVPASEVTAPGATAPEETAAEETAPEQAAPDEVAPQPDPGPVSRVSAGSAEPGSPSERPRWPSVVALRSGNNAATGPSAEGPGGVALWVTQEQPATDSWEEPADDQFARQPRLIQAGRALSQAAVRNSREHPLEAAAVVLLGLGGAAYPPVWLLGAGIAAASRVWDYRDKWIGLAGPVVLLVVGTVAGIALGSQHSTFSSYWHEGWLYADVLSRVGSLLGAAYLGWRMGRGRREPPVPPWSRPHRVG
jgi:hypothetical protein